MSRNGRDENLGRDELPLIRSVLRAELGLNADESQLIPTE